MDEALESVYRADRSRVLARLIGILGDFDLAEDALQDAWVAALATWPALGDTRQPGGMAGDHGPSQGGRPAAQHRGV